MSEELLLKYLPLIQRAIAFASQRQGLTRVEAEDFESTVKLKLIEDDYAILRAFQGRSSPTTYFVSVAQRILLDHRNKEWGKWRASAEAKRLGPTAVELERHLHRDGLTPDEAFGALKSNGHNLTRDAMEALAKRLPPRAPKRRVVPLDEAGRDAVIGSEQIEAEAAGHERRIVEERVSALVNGWLGKLPDKDWFLLHQQFGEGMTVAQIARATRDDPQHLYRRIKRRLDEIRKLLETSGLTSAEVLDLIGRNDTILDFLLRRNPPRPSKDCHGETTAADPEEP
ncbi:MAG TPA: sigma-70 family RNA polymerase sigma factor [Thermoanaerobaculia bacterium]|nr:sigma-70 family RNA polymerase sigma factor [Thermoanaerobaculia bacterium]